MERLGDDVLGLVASHLGAEDACREMVRVSRGWRCSLINSTRLWYEFAAAASLNGTGPYDSLVADPTEPPWRRAPGPQFAHGLVTSSSEEEGSAGMAGWYDLWRRYSLGEEEHRQIVGPFFRSSRRLAQTIRSYNNRLRPVNEAAGPITLWLLAWAQLAILAAALEHNIETQFIPTVPSHLAFGVSFLWWLANIIPSILKCLHRHHHVRILTRRVLPQTRFYEHVAPPNSIGASAWPLAVPFFSTAASDNNINSGLLRGLEATALISFTITLIDPNNLDGLWWMCAPAAVGFFWLAKTDQTPEDDECPVSRASVGYLSAAIGTMAVALVSRWETVMPLVAPFCIASAAIWLEMTKGWSDFDPCACCWLCWLCCQPNLGFRRILRGSGLITLWLSGIVILVRADLQLFNATTMSWPQTISWPIIFLPLAWNLALLCPYPKS